MKKLFFTLLVAISATTFGTAQTKVAHVDGTKILDTLPTRKAGIKEIEKAEMIGMKELTFLDSMLQVNYNIYLRDKDGMSPTIREYTERKLQQDQQFFEQKRNELEADLRKKEAALQEKNLKTITEATKIVAKAKKLNYVMDKSAMLYFDESLDVTNEVITEALKLDKQ